MEYLNIAGMSKNKNLAKHILDAGWYSFKEMLSYKTKVVLINPQGTSQECFSCGYISSGNRKSQSDFICQQCGHADNADCNASKNILRRGQRQLAQSTENTLRLANE